MMYRKQGCNFWNFNSLLKQSVPEFEIGLAFKKRKPCIGFVELKNLYDNTLFTQWIYTQIT